MLEQRGVLLEQLVELDRALTWLGVRTTFKAVNEVPLTDRLVEIPTGRAM